MKTGTLTAAAAAALFGSAAAWALHQQIGYVLSSVACGQNSLAIWLVTAFAFILLIAGALVSWRIIAPGNAGAKGGAPRPFLALIGIFASGLFLFAIFLQAAAVLFLPGCAG
jgi:hypothetical protein